MYVQASLLAAAARTAEVSALKQDLERSENELDPTRGSSRREKVSNTLSTLLKRSAVVK